MGITKMRFFAQRRLLRMLIVPTAHQGENCHGSSAGA